MKKLLALALCALLAISCVAFASAEEALPTFDQIVLGENTDLAADIHFVYHRTDIPDKLTGYVEEFQKTNDAITSITGGEIRLFRAPGGGINDAVFNNSLGMYSILWTIDTLDWETKNAQQTYDTVINNVRDGDIILMHEIYEASLEASRMLIPKLKEMGYQLVTVSELAAAKGVTLETGVSYGAF